MINLYDKIPNAESFTYNEFIKSSTAIRMKIDNIPTDEEIWNNITLLATNVLQPLRNEFGPIKITSGYRSPDLNVAIGGSRTSNHCLGEAADIEPINNNISLITIFEFIYVNLDFRELIAEFFPSGWIHVAYRKNANIKSLKLKDNFHNYSLVSMEYLKKLYKN